VASARAQLEQARVNLERTTVEAPFDGRVREKQADVGQSVTPGTPLGRVFASDYAEVRLPVPVAELAYLDVDLTGAMEDGPETLLAADLAGERRTWPARIVRTAGAVDADTRMLALVARVDRPYGEKPGEKPGEAKHAVAAPLPMGLFVEATIAGRRAEGVIVLPRSALRDGLGGLEGPDLGDPGDRRRQGSGRVLVVEPGAGGEDGSGPDRLRFREVRLLRLSGDRAVVSGGLEEGERIVVSPLETPVDGMAVRVAGDGAQRKGAR
jgi:RND family efflux transporter MFP subunit